MKYQRSFCVKTCEKFSLTREIFLTLEEKFRISARPCNILYIFNTFF